MNNGDENRDDENNEDVGVMKFEVEEDDDDCMVEVDADVIEFGECVVAVYDDADGVVMF